MKKLLLGLLLPTSLIAQISLNVNDFSDGGDVLWISTAIDPTIDFSTTGANQTWDFSNLTAQNQNEKVYFNMSAASAFVNFQFGGFAPNAYQATNFTASSAIPLDQLTSFLPVTIDNVFQFSKNSNSSINSIGFAISVNGNEIPFRSDTIETRYALPLNYSNTYASHGFSEVDMNPFFNAIWRQHRHRQSEVDGWGSVITPLGTFQCLRIKHQVTETDSLFMDIAGNGMWLPLPIPKGNVYEWIAQGEKEPIMRINTSIIAGNETVTTIEYLDVNQNLGIEENSDAVSIYPNPTTDKLYIQSNEMEGYLIVSSDGSMIDIGSGNITELNLEDLVPGIYTLIIKSKDSFTTHEFIKQ